MRRTVQVTIAASLIGAALGTVPVGSAHALVAVTENVGVAAVFATPVGLAGGRLAFLASESGAGASLNGDADTSDAVTHVYDPDTDAVTNVGLASAGPVALDGGRVAFLVSESGQGASLNGDGDTTDDVVHVYDPATDTTVNVGRATASDLVALDGGKLAFRVSETGQSTNYNADADTFDEVYQVFDPATNATTNVGIAGVGFAGSDVVALDGGSLAFRARESAQGVNFNGDGDLSDQVPHVFDPATNTTDNAGTVGAALMALDGGRLAFAVIESEAGASLNGDGDTSDVVPHVFDPATNTLDNVGLASDQRVVVGTRLGFLGRESAQGADFNGDGDTSDLVPHVFDPATDALVDTDIAAFRATGLIGGKLAFHGHEPAQAADFNNDGDMTDLVLHVYDAPTDTAVNTEMVISSTAATALGGGRVAFVVFESDVGASLNGDADILDEVPHVYDPSSDTGVNVGTAGGALVALESGRVAFGTAEVSDETDRNGDGDIGDVVPQVYDPVADAVVNVGVAGAGIAPMDGGGLAFLTSEASEGADLDGDGDTDDIVPHLAMLSDDAGGPVVSGTSASPNAAPVNTAVNVVAVVDDSTTGGSAIAGASYSLDGGAAVAMSAGDGAFDETSETVAATIPAFADAGLHDVCVTGTDGAGNTSAPECVLLAVYDPSAGFVTGGGWINSPAGAYTPDDPNDADVVGRANFAFVSKYKKGAAVPDGQTEFQFQAAALAFRSTSYDWLVVAGTRAQFKGMGVANGVGGYQFLLTAIDGVDRLRIKIWNAATGTVLYDNQPGASDTGTATTLLGGGSIVIHTGKR